MSFADINLTNTTLMLYAKKLDLFSSWHSLNRVIARLVHIAHISTYLRIVRNVRDAACATNSDFQQATETIMSLNKKDSQMSSKQSEKYRTKGKKRSPLTKLSHHTDESGLHSVQSDLKRVKKYPSCHTYFTSPTC
ncbi:hypothetical protein XENORESO_011932 [Xenotaenia resolanae]|uniref:Uncharacterized protein n=1 Tax=Xenotaenia resolanae TaxID=208358 RepID=A0ABV0W4R4_9TELE